VRRRHHGSGTRFCPGGHRGRIEVTQPRPIRLLIAEHHPSVRDQLAAVFTRVADIQLVGAAGDAEEAARIAAEQSPDVVLMDVSMDAAGTAEGSRCIRAAAPFSKLVVLGWLHERATVLTSIDHGAVGYMLKDDAGEELIQAVRAADRGEWPLSPRAAAVVLTERLKTKGRYPSGRES
jgi:DNA-binding NarL/FixJ family response regulator